MPKVKSRDARELVPLGGVGGRKVPAAAMTPVGLTRNEGGT
jgi:hypothetical protein